jgi:group I intron endonuclease
MLIGHIYKIRNIINHHFYIGQTRQSLSRRFSGHKYDSKDSNSNRPICSAIRKYGIESFVIEIVEEIQAYSKDELISMLNEKEIHYILYLKPEYNTAPGGLGNTGNLPWSDERRASFKERMSGPCNHNFGKHLTDEVKQKLSNKHKGKTISEIVRKKTSRTMKGVLKTENTRQNMAKSRQKLLESGWTPPKGSNSKKAISVDQIDKLSLEVIKTFGSITDASEETGASRGNIVNCCKGNAKTSAGFVWKYH